MTEDRDVSRQRDDEKINIDDDADLARWAQALCTTREELLAAVRLAGSEVLRVKGHLFTMLVRQQSRKERADDME
jgi:hypothetical protein